MMKTNPNNRAAAVSEKVYGWLLRAYPPGHRAEYGPAMAQLFRDQCRDAWDESGGWGLVKLWLRVLPDLVSTGIKERLAAWQERKSLSGKLANLSGIGISPEKVFSRVCVVVFLVIFIGTAVVTFLLPKSYGSTTKLLVGIMLDRRNPGDPIVRPVPIDMNVVTSAAVLEPVIKQLDLNTEWGRKYFAGRLLTTPETLKILREHIEVSTSPDSTVLVITAFSDDKVEASEIANTIARSYQMYRHAQFQAEEAERSKRMDALVEPFREQEKQVMTLRKQVELLAGQLGVSKAATSPQSSAQQPYWDLKQKLDGQTLALDEQRKTLNKQLRDVQIQALFGGGHASSFILNTPVIQVASAASVEARPNRPRNIALGGFTGILAAAVSGATAAFIVWSARKRKQKVTVAA